jgi:hypothetical protein
MITDVDLDGDGDDEVDGTLVVNDETRGDE